MAAGLPNYERIPKASHVAPDSAFVFKSHSVNEAPSTSGQIAAGLPIRHHTLGTKYAPPLFVDKDSQGQPHAHTHQSGRPSNIDTPQQMGGRLLGHCSPLSVVDEGIAATISKNIVANSDRGKSIPADAIRQTSLYAASQSPAKGLSTSAAVQLVQKSASLSRRASLAAKLQRLAESADIRSGSPASSAGPTERNSIEDSQIRSMTCSTTLKRTSLDKVSRVGCDNLDDSAPTAQQTSNAVDSKAAGVRRQRLSFHQSSLEQAVRMSSLSLQRADSRSQYGPHSSSTGTKMAHARTAEEPSMQAEHGPDPRRSLSDDQRAPVFRRTLSDAATEALNAVESMQCPIIQYSQLQIQRKIGDGSIGQVGAFPVGLKLNFAMQRANLNSMTK